jgi:hypothetical protein
VDSLHHVHNTGLTGDTRHVVPPSRGPQRTQQPAMPAGPEPVRLYDNPTCTIRQLHKRSTTLTDITTSQTLLMAHKSHMMGSVKTRSPNLDLNHKSHSWSPVFGYLQYTLVYFSNHFSLSDLRILPYIPLVVSLPLPVSCHVSVMIQFIWQKHFQVRYSIFGPLPPHLEFNCFAEEPDIQWHPITPRIRSCRLITFIPPSPVFADPIIPD